LVRRFAGCDAVVYGHTHLPQTERHAGVWILNPGSPTERRRAPARSMLELRIGPRELVPRLVELSA
jgi:predicted phosphodiesterase